jgi:hypothetical protein
MPFLRPAKLPIRLLVYFAVSPTRRLAGRFAHLFRPGRGATGLKRNPRKDGLGEQVGRAGSRPGRDHDSRAAPPEDTAQVLHSLHGSVGHRQILWHHPSRNAPALTA